MRGDRPVAAYQAAIARAIAPTVRALPPDGAAPSGAARLAAAAAMPEFDARQVRLDAPVSTPQAPAPAARAPAKAPTGGLAFQLAAARTPESNFVYGAMAADTLLTRLSSSFTLMEVLNDPVLDRLGRKVEGLRQELASARGRSPALRLADDQLAALLGQLDALSGRFRDLTQPVVLDVPEPATDAQLDAARADRDRRQAAQDQQLLAFKRGLQGPLDALASGLGVTAPVAPPPTPAENFRLAAGQVAGLMIRLGPLFEMTERLRDPAIDAAARAVDGLQRALWQSMTASPPPGLPADGVRALLAQVEPATADAKRMADLPPEARRSWLKGVLALCRGLADGFNPA